jgi:hypothetical protein
MVLALGSPNRKGPNMQSVYIFLDPDGTQQLGIFVIVAAYTGVTYGQQCAGTTTDVRELEGFLLPVSTDLTRTKQEGLAQLVNFFKAYQRFMNDTQSSQWPETLLEELELIIEAIRDWESKKETEIDVPHTLLFDKTRLSEIAEAWVPVHTVYGPGILTWHNSD